MSVEELLNKVDKFEAQYFSLKTGAAVAAGGVTLLAAGKLLRDARKKAATKIDVLIKDAPTFEKACEIQRQSFRYKYPNNPEAYPWLDYLSARPLYIDKYIPNELILFTAQQTETTRMQTVLTKKNDYGVTFKPFRMNEVDMIHGFMSQSYIVETSKHMDPAKYIYTVLNDAGGAGFFGTILNFVYSKV